MLRCSKCRRAQYARYLTTVSGYEPVCISERECKRTIEKQQARVARVAAHVHNDAEHGTPFLCALCTQRRDVNS